MTHGSIRNGPGASPSRAVAVALLAGLLLASPVLAQKGTGEPTGVARKAGAPAVETMSGVVQDIDVGSCERSTGRSLQGVHLVVGLDAGAPINLHLGPAAALEDLLDRLSVGERIGFEAFRTDAMPPDAWVAKSVRVNDETFELRDDNLRPSWAIGPTGGGGGAGTGGMGPGGMGMGSGRGPGQGQGRGAGQGGGACWW